VFKYCVERAGLSDSFFIDSCGTGGGSDDWCGPAPAWLVLAQQISCNRIRSFSSLPELRPGTLVSLTAALQVC